jgi:hypothetical protein
MIVTNPRGFKGPRLLFLKFRHRGALAAPIERCIAAPIDSHQGGPAPKR